ncbi:MAG: hypothetical protein H0W76_20550 [Pyrinomonadaceae bacterium]|nr:hypothetical protein [Pyrinomonadaceae bacterium]
MTNTELIDNLNRALSLELAGMIQYLHHSFLVTGTEREVYRPFFRAQSEEAHAHATMLGDKIVALGGTPTVEPAVIRQSTGLAEMLLQGLELEREALNTYVEAWRSCTDDELPTRFQLEEQIHQEQLHVEELEKLTSERQASVSKERITLRQIS